MANDDPTPPADNPPPPPPPSNEEIIQTLIGTESRSGGVNDLVDRLVGTDEFKGRTEGYEKRG